jgi:RNA polymerase sigma-70 factor (ECF subfamily)
VTSSERTTEFVELLLTSERRIYAYIRSLVPNRSDAEDLLQDTSKVLWEKFDEFTLGSDFAAWAHKVAYYEVQRHRRQQVATHVVFSQELVEQLVDQASLEPERIDRTQEMLGECVSELKEPDRDLLLQRYEPDASVTEIAAELQCPVQTVYSRLKRIRRAVFKCIQRKLGQETSP